MAKTNLEKSIAGAIDGFVQEIISAIEFATLQELLALQQGVLEAPRKKPGPKPGRKKPGPKPGKKAGRKKTGPKPKRKPGRPPKAKADKVVKKKRVVKNYPKCAFPSCNNNRFPRGKGFCGEHWREWKDGKIKSAEKYK